MNRKYNITIIISLLILLTTSCKTTSFDQRIHNIWLVTAVDGEAVGENDFSGELPTIEFNTTDLTFMGTTGCNRIQGGFTLENSTISFGHSLSTLMMCEKTTVSDRISAILSLSMYSFKFEDSYLVFYFDSTEIIRFINID